MTDTELIEEVRWALDDATTGVWADPDLATRVRARARRRRRLRVRRGLLATVPAAGLAVGLLVAGVPGGAPAPGPAGHTKRAAYVTSHVEAALGQASGYIVQTTFQPSPGDTTITWLDPVTEDSRQVTSSPEGEVITWIRPGTDAGQAVRWQTTVDQRTRTWSTVALPATTSVVKTAEPGAEPAAEASANARAKAAVVAEASPALIMQELEQGQVTVAGQQQLDGKTAVVLRLLAAKAVAQLYVDRSTYRPVRIVFGSGDGTFVLNMVWVPRTGAVLASLSAPQVPAGYTHVATPGQ